MEENHEKAVIHGRELNNEDTTHPVHGTDYELRFGRPTGPDTIVMHPKNYAAWQEEQRAFAQMNRKQRRAEMSRGRKR